MWIEPCQTGEYPRIEYLKNLQAGIAANFIQLRRSFAHLGQVFP